MAAGLVHALPGNNAGGQYLDFTGLRSLDRPLAVNGLANAVNNAPFHFRTNRNLGNAPGALDDIAFLDVADAAQNGATDVVLFQIQSKTVKYLNTERIFKKR